MLEFLLWTNLPLLKRKHYYLMYTYISLHSVFILRIFILAMWHCRFFYPSFDAWVIKFLAEISWIYSLTEKWLVRETELTDYLYIILYFFEVYVYSYDLCSYWMIRYSKTCISVCFTKCPQKFLPKQ